MHSLHLDWFENRDRALMDAMINSIHDVDSLESLLTHWRCVQYALAFVRCVPSTKLANCSVQVYDAIVSQATGISCGQGCRRGRVRHLRSGLNQRPVVTDDHNSTCYH